MRRATKDLQSEANESETDKGENGETKKVGCR
jgi:hypothetical protein